MTSSLCPCDSHFIWQQPALFLPVCLSFPLPEGGSIRWQQCLSLSKDISIWRPSHESGQITTSKGCESPGRSQWGWSSTHPNHHHPTPLQPAVQQCWWGPTPHWARMSLQSKQNFLQEKKEDAFTVLRTAPSLYSALTAGNVLVTHFSRTRINV